MGTEPDRRLALAITVGLLAAGLSSGSCIIPDHGIVVPVDCGARWCATAAFAEALNPLGEITQVQQTQPDGSTGWVTACMCMTPTDDLVLQSGAPQIQYELLRTQIIDATRQACLDAAVANGLEPDPPYPLDEQLQPSCYEAVTTVFHDGCCSLLSSACEGNTTCRGNDPTGGTTTDPTTTDPPGPDTADTTDGADSSTGSGWKRSFGTSVP